MTWAKFDDQFPEHPKVRAVGPLGLALHTAAVCYCARHLTDGRLSASVADALVRSVMSPFTDPAGARWAPALKQTAKQLAKQAAALLPAGEQGASSDAVFCAADAVDFLGIMVAAGLWERSKDGASYVVHDYLEYNPSRREVLQKRKIAAQNGRLGGLAKTKQNAKQIAKRVGTRSLPRPLGSLPTPVPVPVPVPVPLNEVKNVSTNVVANATEPGLEPPDSRQVLLLDDILAVTRDAHSLTFYRSVVAQLPEERVRAILAETRGAIAEGRVRKSPARMFTHLARKAMQQRNGLPEARGP